MFALSFVARAPQQATIIVSGQSSYIRTHIMSFIPPYLLRSCVSPPKQTDPFIHIIICKCRMHTCSCMSVHQSSTNPPYTPPRSRSRVRAQQLRLAALQPELQLARLLPNHLQPLLDVRPPLQVPNCPRRLPQDFVELGVELLFFLGGGSMVEWCVNLIKEGGQGRQRRGEKRDQTAGYRRYVSIYLYVDIPATAPC